MGGPSRFFIVGLCIPRAMPWHAPWNGVAILCLLRNPLARNTVITRGPAGRDGCAIIQGHDMSCPCGGIKNSPFFRYAAKTIHHNFPFALQVLQHLPEFFFVYIF